MIIELFENELISYTYIAKIVNTQKSACIIPPFVDSKEVPLIKKWFEKQECSPGLYRYFGKEKYQAFGASWEEVILYIKEFQNNINEAKHVTSIFDVYNVVSIILGLAALDVGAKMFSINKSRKYLIKNLDSFKIDTILVDGFEPLFAEKISGCKPKYLKRTLVLASNPRPNFFSGSNMYTVTNCCLKWRQTGTILKENI